MNRLAVAALLVTTVLGTACRKPAEQSSAPTDGALAEDGADANDIESHASALTASVTLPTTQFDVQPERAALSAENTRSFFLPMRCVTTTRNGTTVTHLFNACAGPWGLARVTGKVDVTYSTTTVDGHPALQLDVVGSDVHFGKAIGDFHATARVFAPAADQPDREMRYSAQVSGTTARGKALSRQVDWTLKWRVGEACLAVDGTAKGTVNQRSVETSIANFSSCRGECPAAGGTITIKEMKDDVVRTTVTVAYDGDDTANVSVAGSTNVTTTVKLACGL